MATSEQKEADRQRLATPEQKKAARQRKSTPSALEANRERKATDKKAAKEHKQSRIQFAKQIERRKFMDAHTQALPGILARGRKQLRESRRWKDMKV